MLTYKTHIDKDALISHLNKATWETVFCRCAHENGKHAGEDDAYPHTHVLVDYGRRRDSVKGATLFDYDGIHPHIEVISQRGDGHWKNALKYLAKEDAANADLKTTEVSSVEQLWSCETLSDALIKNNVSLSSVPGAIAAWGIRPDDYEKMKEPENWRPWQAQLLAVLSTPLPDDAQNPEYRLIHWVYDKNGSAGKSLLSAFLEDHRGAYATSWGRAIDVYYDLSMQPSLKRRTLVFDLPRRAELTDFYSPMEKIANGKFFSTKYVPKLVRFNRGHIVVFANFMPDILGWTHDRYDLWMIKDKNEPVIRLTLSTDHKWC